MKNIRRAISAVSSIALAVIVGACGTGSASPSEAAAPNGPPGPISPAPTLPGTPGHFDNGEFSFDYPTDWPLIAAGFSSGRVEYVVAVMGNGTWKEGCVYTANSMACGPDTFDVPSGGILVKVYRWWGGPLVMCQGDTQANATFGSLAVRERVDGVATTWELRVPGNEFGQNNNIFIEVHTSAAAQLARAVALLGSFRWDLGADHGGMCASPSVQSPAPSGS